MDSFGIKSTRKTLSTLRKQYELAKHIANTVDKGHIDTTRFLISVSLAQAKILCHHIDEYDSLSPEVKHDIAMTVACFAYAPLCLLLMDEDILKEAENAANSTDV